MISAEEKVELEESLAELQNSLETVRNTLSYYYKKVGLRKFRGKEPYQCDLDTIKEFVEYREKLKDAIAQTKAVLYSDDYFKSWYYRTGRDKVKDREWYKKRGHKKEYHR